MAIPDYQGFMKPLLDITKDGATHKFSDACDVLAVQLKLTDEEILQLLPSGRYPIFRSRVGWAKTYLTKAALLKIEGRGNFKITKRGLDAYASKQSIDSKYLLQFPEFLAFQQKSNLTPSNTTLTGAPQPKVDLPSEVAEQKTPDELLESAYRALRQTLTEDLLDQVQASKPEFFEKLVVDLLVAMGYGGSRKDAAQVVGKSGDGGIDGIIKEDRLGLDAIYVQAKRWNGTSTISRPEIQKFVGALQGNQASKGVFITTAKFSDSARQYVKNLQCKVVLIDGEELCRYLIDFSVGVSVQETYVLKKVDLDYFTDE